MGQLVEWPEVVTEDKTIEGCHELLADCFARGGTCNDERGVPLVFASEAKQSPSAPNQGRARRYRVLSVTLVLNGIASPEAGLAKTIADGLEKGIFGVLREERIPAAEGRWQALYQYERQ